MVILLVCSGNTCRSPLAAAMLAAKLSQRPPQVEVLVIAVGTNVTAGTPASEGAYLVGLERGLDLSAHRSQPITSVLIEKADHILTMGRSHAARVREMGGGEKVELLTEFSGETIPQDIPDPWGGDIATYREVAALLDGIMERTADRIRRVRPS